MRSFLYALLHAFIGGAATGAAMIPTDAPFTAHNVLLPIAAGAITSIISLYAQPPRQQPKQ
jgi:hypothetical protein